MKESSYENRNGELVKVKSNVLFGTLGAILGAMLGAMLWIAIYQIGFIAYIAGAAIIYCSYKGYILFSKSKGKKAAVISVLVSVIILCLTHYFCWGLAIYTELGEEFGITLIGAMQSVPTFVFTQEAIAEDSQFIMEFCKELLIGLIMIGVGYSSFIKKDIQKEAKKNKGV